MLNDAQVRIDAPRNRERRFAAGLLRDAAGASAVEFALLLPVMVILLVGMAELSHAVDNWRKVTLLARTVADLTSQGDSTDPIATATMADIMGSSASVLRPFPTGNVSLVVSAMGVDSKASLTSPRVCSSYASSKATPRAVGVATDLTIPAGSSTNGSRYVLAEVSVPYAPMMGPALTRVIKGIVTPTLRSSVFWPVRNGVAHNSASNSPEVVMPGGSPCP